MQLYIDSNIYLEYFRENSAERLAPLEELVKLIEAGKISLLIPLQTEQEYFRNKSSIAEATRFALVQQSRASFIIPATLDKKIPEIKKILKGVDVLEKAYKKLIEKYDKAVEKEKTDADLLIKNLFDNLGKNLLETDSIVQHAYLRYMKGNPPRKSDYSYGDAIIWETLLESCVNDNLVIISKDGDFIEKNKGKSVLNNFLANEWRIKTKRKKRAKLFKSLAEFVNDFNKEQTIKKEVVEKEKKEGIFSVLTATALETMAEDCSRQNNIFVSNDSELDGTCVVPAVRLDGLASPFSQCIKPEVSTNNEPIFCPYCGHRLLNVFLCAGNEYMCNSCRKNFRVS